MHARIGVAMICVLLTSGCTAVPTPTGDPPPLSELALSADGLAAVRIGKPPPVADPARDVLILSPTVCQSEVDEGYRDDPAMWVANYEPALLGHNPKPFGAEVDGEGVQVIEVYDPAIATTEGIRIGSTAAEVTAAYGDSLELVQEYEDGSDSHLYRVAGTAGDLYIEVLKAEAVKNHPDVGGELVLRLTASAKGRVPLGTNSDFVLGVCGQP